MVPVHTAGLPGSWLWIACCQYFFAEQISRLGWSSPYSMAGNYISDLGAAHCTADLCSPWHALMNASFILQGLLIIGGCFAVRRALPVGIGISMSLALIALGGLGTLLVGVFPEDVNSRVHYAVAAVYFIAANAGIVLLGARLLSLQPSWKQLALYSLLSGSIGLVATALLGRKMTLGFEIGTVERLASYPFTLWLSVAGWTLWRWSKRGDPMANGPLSAGGK